MSSLRGPFFFHGHANDSSSVTDESKRSEVLFFFAFGFLAIHRLADTLILLKTSSRIPQVSKAILPR